jgi:hypothetical protein
MLWIKSRGSTFASRCRNGDERPSSLSLRGRLAYSGGFARALRLHGRHPAGVLNVPGEPEDLWPPQTRLTSTDLMNRSQRYCVCAE